MASSMAFSRAFSMKRDKPSMEISTPAFVGRTAIDRNNKPIMRTQISSPMALEWTSNVHVQTAHAIAGTVPIEIRKISSSSLNSVSSDESDASCDSASSEATITDASSVDESPSPVSPIEPEVKTKRFSYGKALIVDVKRSSRSISPVSPVSPLDSDTTPKIPQRSPSRNQQSPEKMHQQQSHQRGFSASTQNSIVQSQTDIFGNRSSIKQSTARGLRLASSAESARSSYDTIGQRARAPTLPTADKPSPTTIEESPLESPFGQELAQLYEVAQQFGQTTRTAEEDSDVIHMEKCGLATFSAADYMWEIQSLVHNMFADEQPFFRHLGGFF